MPLPEKRRLCARFAAAPVLAEAGKGPRSGHGNLCLAVAEAAVHRAAGGLKLAKRPLSASRARGWSTRPDPELVSGIHWATCEDQSTSEGGSTDDRLNSTTVVDDAVLMGEVKQCAEVLDAMGAMNVVGQMVRPELFDLFEEQEGEALGRRVTVLEERLAAVEAMLNHSPTFVKVGNSDDSKGGGVEFGKNERLSGDDPSGRDFPRLRCMQIS